VRVPILTYHGVNIAGNDYLGNDHVAFAADLALIQRLGLRIVPVAWVVDNLQGRTQRDLTDCVALTCDDGSDFDYHDLDHPQHGRQRSFYNTLLDFRGEHGRDAQPGLHLTSFVIADPVARAEMDRSCLVGRDWMNAAWWRAAQDVFEQQAVHPRHRHQLAPGELQQINETKGPALVLQPADAPGVSVFHDECLHISNAKCNPQKRLGPTLAAAQPEG
jgi:hypothetical protein